jgi:hypothetical protein
MRGRTRFAAVAAASIALLLPAAAQAQQVTGLEVRQGDGFATLSWDPVAGASDYQIERTVAGAPLGTGVVVGVWRPNRQINQGEPAFADAGFNPGASFQWRVRARIGTAAQPYSEPVSGTTRPGVRRSGDAGSEPRTQWEQTDAATYTSDVERVRVHGRARRRQRAGARGDDRAHRARAADQHVHHRRPGAEAGPRGPSPAAPRRS